MELLDQNYASSPEASRALMAPAVVFCTGTFVGTIEGSNKPRSTSNLRGVLRGSVRRMARPPEPNAGRADLSELRSLQIHRHVRGAATHTSLMSQLTERQQLALELVSNGLATKQIAARMLISEAGAKKHINTLLRRYDAANRAQLVRRAIELGELHVPAFAEPAHNLAAALIADDFGVACMVTFTSLRHGSASHPSPDAVRTIDERRAITMSSLQTLTIEIRVPQDYVEVVSRDLRGRGGSVSRVDQGTDDPSQLVIGRIPASELSQYGAELRRLTAGRGTFEARP